MCQIRSVGVDHFKLGESREAAIRDIQGRGRSLPQCGCAPYEGPVQTEPENVVHRDERWRILPLRTRARNHAEQIQTTRLMDARTPVSDLRLVVILHQ